MDAKNNDSDRMEDVMMPGFRFHPTDEELVGFYLKRQIQQRSLPIELIKQVDIYKYDPWDLPKLASTGEKESYFYCPRDRKYRNSARPNRVTGAGFWKATGTDRPIYSDGNKCIGLKKSLVFYRGRAARGIKTDWMMHEFRLPSVSDSAQSKKLLDKTIPANDSWAICRIFKKTNSVAQRAALSQYWNTSFPEASASDGLNQTASFSPDSISCQAGSQQATNASFSALEIPMYRTINQTFSKSSIYSIQNGDFPTNLVSLPFDIPRADKCTIDIASMLSNDTRKMSEPVDYEEPPHYFSGSLISTLHEMQGSMPTEENEADLTKNLSTSCEQNHVGAMRSIGFPFAMPSNLSEAWEPSLPLDSHSCPDELSPSYSISSVRINISDLYYNHITVLIYSIKSSREQIQVLFQHSCTDV